MLIKSVGDLGARVRERRQQLGLTQADLALRLGVSRYSVMRLERGNAGTEIGLVLNALAALGLDMDVRIGTALTRFSGAARAGGDDWTPDLAAILDRMRGRRP